MDSKEKSLIIVLGPTGVGKSATALWIARDFQGEVINCDSMQVYQGFDIGTDKLPLESRAGIPHHLVDIQPPTEQFTAADFARRALETAEEILSRGHRPVIAGGTGLYLKALIDGLFPEGRISPEIRKQLEAEVCELGLPRLHDELERVDPAYAARTGANDRVRIIRALEVYRATGKPLSQHFAQTRSYVSDFHLIRIGLQLDRKELYARINQRVERMFAQGMIDEVRSLLAEGVPESAPPFRALGYAQVLRYLNGEITEEEAKSLTQRDTRHYAKRQITWFKKMSDVHWFSALDPTAIRRFLLSRLT